MMTIDAMRLRLPVRLSASVLPRVAKILRMSASSLALWRQKRASRRVLRHMTDDELRDIGITRREAMREVSKSFFWD